MYVMEETEEEKEMDKAFIIFLCVLFCRFRLVQSGFLTCSGVGVNYGFFVAKVWLPPGWKNTRVSKCCSEMLMLYTYIELIYMTE